MVCGKKQCMTFTVDRRRASPQSTDDYERLTIKPFQQQRVFFCAALHVFCAPVLMSFLLLKAASQPSLYPRTAIHIRILP